MCNLGDPVYERVETLSRTRLNNLKDEELLRSYYYISGSFKFEKDVKYPSIPTDLPGSGPGPLLSIYPSSGHCAITGYEYLLAVRIQKCKFLVDKAFRIPTTEYAPFRRIMLTLQRERRKHPKGSLLNVLYKLLGNGGYGILCRGFSDQRSFDIETGSTKRMPANDISNIVLGAATTSLARSVIGELLHNINVLGGKVVSVTTDGFITDIKDLENVILNSKSKGISKTFLNLYRSTREYLCGNPEALEMKNSVRGLLSWCVRGQQSIDGKLSAVTGLQKRNVASDSSELGKILKNVLLSGDRSMRYLQSRLRSGREIYETGYHVCEILQERDFNMFSDNRRVFAKEVTEGGFHDSEPFDNVRQCDLNRFVSRMGRVVRYQRTASMDVPVDVKKHSGCLDTAVRKFIRSLFVNEYNVHYNGVFGNYRQLLLYIYVMVTGKGYINGVKMEDALLSGDKFSLNVNNISTLKRRHVKQGPLKGYRKDVNVFIENVKRSGVFPNFDIDGFLNSYMQNEVVVKNTKGLTDDRTTDSVLDVKLIKEEESEGKRVKQSSFRKELDVDVDKIG